MRNKHTVGVAFVLGFMLLTMLLSACGSETAAPAATATATATVAPTTSATDEPEATSPPTEGDDGTTAEELAAAVASRTPVPTPIPGLLTELVSEVVGSTKVARQSILGLTIEDWINVGVSLVMVVIIYLLGTWLTKSVLRRVVRRTPTEFDDEFLEAIGPHLRWLVVVLALQIAVLRLGFLSDTLRTFLGDVFFPLYLVIGFSIAWKLLGFGVDWYRKRLAQEEGAERLDPVITLAHRVIQAFLITLALITLLAHFDINVTAFAASLGIAGLALSLAVQDTLADAISGFIILIDQPFRVGDRIEISGLGTWGDVVAIGSRTTRIRTRDNRMVIVPNSTIGKSQVINYTYPDPQYRVEMDIGIGYGMDIEKTRQIIVDTVRRIEGVLPDKPVEALYNEMGDSAMLFRVRWWIESYADTRLMFDRVNTALQNALDQAGIDMPYPTQSLILQVDPGTIKRLYLSRQEPDSVRDRPAARSVPNEGEAEEQTVGER